MAVTKDLRTVIDGVTIVLNEGTKKLEAPGSSSAGSLETTGALVDVSSADPPSAGQVLTASSPTAASWVTPTGGGGGGLTLSPEGVFTGGAERPAGYIYVLDPGESSLDFIILTTADFGIKALDIPEGVEITIEPNGNDIEHQDGSISGAPFVITTPYTYEEFIWDDDNSCWRRKTATAATEGGGGSSLTLRSTLYNSDDTLGIWEISQTDSSSGDVTLTIPAASHDDEFAVLLVGGGSSDLNATILAPTAPVTIVRSETLGSAESASFRFGGTYALYKFDASGNDGDGVWRLLNYTRGSGTGEGAFSRHLADQIGDPDSYTRVVGTAQSGSLLIGDNTAGASWVLPGTVGQVLTVVSADYTAWASGGSLQFSATVHGTGNFTATPGTLERWNATAAPNAILPDPPSNNDKIGFVQVGAGTGNLYIDPGTKTIAYDGSLFTAYQVGGQTGERTSVTLQFDSDGDTWRFVDTDSATLELLNDHAQQSMIFKGADNEINFVTVGTSSVVGRGASGNITSIALSSLQLMAVSSISANTTAAVGTIYLVDSTSGTITVTLPAVASSSGKQIVVKRKTGSNSVVIDGNASETIDGATTLTLSLAFEWTTLVCDGAAWFQIS